MAGRSGRTGRSRFRRRSRFFAPRTPLRMTVSIGPTRKRNQLLRMTGRSRFRGKSRFFAPQTPLRMTASIGPTRKRNQLLRMTA
jgi:hypothetical protein